MPPHGGELLICLTIAGWHGWSDIGWTGRLNQTFRPVTPEAGFFTSAADAAVLNSKAKRAALVRAMADAIAPPGD